MQIKSGVGSRHVPRRLPSDLPAPLDRRIGYQLRRAFFRSNGLFARLGGEAGLAPGQFGVLKLVELNPGRSQTEIAAAAGLDRSSLTQLLDQLVGRGLIERRPGRDRRTVSLHLTAAGAKAAAKAEPKVEAHEAIPPDRPLRQGSVCFTGTS